MSSGKGGKGLSGYILCQTRKAEIPYFIENISTNIYTLEELCYYLFHNLYLVDQTIINENLCAWIQDELKLPGLAGKLRAVLGQFFSVEDVLYPVFKEINYLTYEELKILNGKLQQLDREPQPVRDKQKGDALMENGMYVHAIQVYQKILENEDPEECREGLTKSICHNLGCAFCYLFQMDKALEYFKKACEAGGDREDLKTYLLAVHSTGTQEEYERALQEVQADDSLAREIREALADFAEKPKPQVPEDGEDELLEKLTREYHRCTGS